MWNFSKCILPVVASVSMIAPCAAHEHRHWEHRGPWHGEIHHFHERDFGLWRGGHWHHGRHGGHLGWWWIAGSTWYFYPAPVYPYPDPYYPPTAEAPPPPASDAPPQYWYYCSDPAGYYPYVPTCTTPWQKVPAQPGE